MLLGVLALLLLVAGCGDSGEEQTADAPADPAASDAEPVDPAASEPTETEASAAPADGEPIVVGSINTETSPAGTFKEITDAAEAYINRLNEDGGVNGRQIEFRRCDDQGDPAIGEDCARQMVEAGAAAVLGGISFTTDAFLPVLQGEGIPYVGGLLLFPGDYTSEIWYAITNGGGSAALHGNACYLLNEDLTSGAIMNADVGAPDPTLQRVLEENGGEILQEVQFPPDAADLTPFIQNAIQGDPGFVSVQTDGPNTVRIVTGLRSAGYEGQIVVLASAADPESVEAMGDAGNGVVLSQFFKDASAAEEEPYVQFREDMEQYFPETNLSAFALNGYLASLVTTEVMTRLDGEITPEAMIEGLENIDGLDGGGFFEPPLSAENATEEFPRTYYYTTRPNQIQDGELVPALDYTYDWLTCERLGDAEGG